MHTTDNAIVSPGVFERAKQNFAAHQQAIFQDTDRMFAVLMAVQWVAGIAAALWISPRTWVGTASQTSMNVWAAIFLGGVINFAPIVLAIKNPGKLSTRYVIATAQMLMSGLLIHLTGGRIETHFHVFGSLAFLSFYRDRKVLIPATVVVALDHILRGAFWPESVYGVLFASQWRWLEHAGWVLFEDAVLLVAIKRSCAEMWDIAVRGAQSDDLNETLENRVADRTEQIVTINKGLEKEITERRIAENALRYSEERYRLLFESNPHPMWVYDAEHLTFLAVNQVAIDRYGYSRDEFLRMSIMDIRPDEDVSAIKDKAKKDSQFLAAGVWKHRKKDGTTIDVEITSHSVEFSDRSARLVLANDVTERKRMEDERQAMFEIIQGVSATANLDELLKIIHQSISKLVYAENCFVALHDDASGLMHFPFWRDHHDSGPAPRPLGKGFSSYILRTGQPILLDRELTEEFVQRGEVTKSGTTSASWLGVPLRTPARTIGVLVLQHYQDENAYSQRDLEFLMSVGGQVAMAIERKRTEEALQISEAQHRSIFDNATMGIYRSSADGKVIKANDAFVKMLGYDSVEELLQCNLGRDVYFYPEERTSLLSRRPPIGVAHELEVLWKKKDGTPIWVHLNAKAVVDSDNSVHFDTCIHDVTQRVQAEEALRHSERRFAQAFNASPQPMSITTLKEGRYIDVNDSFLTVSGCTRDEVIGHTTTELGIWRSEQDRRAMIDLLNSTGSVRNFETRVLTKQGEARVLLSSVEKVEIDAEECLLISSSDITERKQAEESLREANERALKDYEHLVERIASLGQTLGNARELNTIFRALRDFAIVSVPCDGLVISLYDAERESRRIRYCWTDQKEFDPTNLAQIPVGNGMTGRAIKSGNVIIDNNYHRQLKAAKVVVSVGDRVDPHISRSALAAPMTFMGRTVGCVEAQTHRPGSYQQEHATAMRMAANLAATAIENVRLIEREQAQEEQLRQAQKMEAVGNLAGGIAHDFNNLLTAITGYSELTLRDLPTDSPSFSKVSEIKKAGERAASLTRQLLAFSRKQILQPKVLDLNAVIPEMEKMLRRLIGEHIVLETVLDRSLGQVKADPGQIEQILMNLSVNARDAMPDGGRLTIETSNVSLREGYRNQQVSIRAGNYVMLSVSDNGCGMDSETQAHIFEPFFTTKELGKGTGLGLSTVYGIVKQSEGTIWVYSEVGQGTSFKIFLPRVDEVGVAPEQTGESRPATGGQETILVVEDEDVVRALSCEVLEKHGYRLLSAANGDEGLRLCREFAGRIDLLITDVVMPGMSGRELAENLVALRPDTRVLFMSGFTDDAIVRHGVLDDGVFFIQKPFSPDALASKARSVLDHVDQKRVTSVLEQETAVAPDLGERNYGHPTVN